MDLISILKLTAGIALLVISADVLVRGAARLAAALSVPPLVIGLTVVAYGTSAPELAVSVQSAFAGQADLAIGNVVGSNIFNILLILGASALVAPLIVREQLVRLDVPLMIVLSVLVLLLGLDGRIGRFDGAFLASGAVIYSVLLIRLGRRRTKRELAATREEDAVARKADEARAAGEGTGVSGDDATSGIEIDLPELPDLPAPGDKTRWWLDVILIVVGAAGLVLGSNWLVDAAVTIAAAFGVSELVIGLTVVAAGTSLPEAATSLVAAAKGERDIAVGNAVGSNIFNILMVLGFSAVVAPDGIPVPAAVMGFDLPVMIAVAVACVPVFATGHRIERWEGAVFLGYFVAYIGYVVLKAQGHDALPVFNAVMVWFVVPLTVITFIVVGWRAFRGSRARRAAA